MYPTLIVSQEKSPHTYELFLTIIFSKNNFTPTETLNKMQWLINNQDVKKQL